jgi:hypothetical protein
MCLLRRLKGFIGVFQRLFGMFVSGLVILFPVVCRGGTMSVCGEFVEFGRSLMRFVWHSTLPLWSQLYSRLLFCIFHYLDF